MRAPHAAIEAVNQKNVMQQQALTAQNEYEMAKKWDGKTPQASSGAMPLLRLSKP